MKEKCWTHVRWLIQRDEGATMIEYGLMVALIALVAVAAVGLFGASVNGLFDVPF
jgi:pilus assembly protein Flp/PilA